MTPPPGALPQGDPAPLGGRLPEPALAALRAAGGLSAYLHVPFCRVRCGYCDFNTYAPGELHGPAGTSSTYLAAMRAEVALAGEVLAPAGACPIRTVFIGGGTPTLLAPADLAGLLGALRERWPFARDAEVTTEANPDSVDAASMAALAAGGITRVSVGMQSAVPAVLRTLERTHDPANVARAVSAARDAGLAVSLDLIYGTPGESPADWRTSLESAIALEPDHISAYALVVEPGTKMAAQVRRGVLPMPDDDDEADKYELADEMLAAAGYDWYEVSNWARPGAACRHNLEYWRGGHWWGFGPGAHSHIGGTRWWNVKHPGAYAARLAEGASPAAGREDLTPAQRHDEAILLGIRVAEGLAESVLHDRGRAQLPGLLAEGLVTLQPLRRPSAAGRPRRIVLTRRGRLLADTVVRRLIDS